MRSRASYSTTFGRVWRNRSSSLVACSSNSRSRARMGVRSACQFAAGVVLRSEIGQFPLNLYNPFPLRSSDSLRSATNSISRLVIRRAACRFRPGGCRVVGERLSASSIKSMALSVLTVRNVAVRCRTAAKTASDPNTVNLVFVILGPLRWRRCLRPPVEEPELAGNVPEHLFR